MEEMREIKLLRANRQIAFKEQEIQYKKNRSKARFEGTERQSESWEEAKAKGSWRVLGAHPGQG